MLASPLERARQADPATVATRPATLEPERVHRHGWSFRLEAPDWATATLELADGVVTRLTASFYVPPSQQRGLEFHGDEGSLFMATWAEFDSRVELQPRGGAYERVAPVREPYAGIDWTRALVDLADAIEHDRPHRSTGEHAAHVVEVLDAARASAENGGAGVEVRSEFRRPEPLEWAR